MTVDGVWWFWKMKIALFCLFFMKEWPLYLIGLLRTAEYNPNVDFYFVTNLNFSDPSWSEANGGKPPPNNVRIIPLTFEDLLKKINGIYAPKYSLHSEIRHYKVNDFKPLIGRIFQSHLSEYSHWGYFDPDIVAGNLTSVYAKHTEDVISYGAIPAQGPLMVIKNTQQTTNFDKYFPEVMMNAIFNERPSLVDELLFSQFLKTQSEISHIILDADCETQKTWLYYQGKLWGESGECALIHFGGGPSRSSASKKLHETHLLRPFYLNITRSSSSSSSVSSEVSYGFGFSRIRGYGFPHYYFQVFSNDTQRIHPMNISLTEQDWDVVERNLPQANKIWKNMNQKLKI